MFPFDDVIMLYAEAMYGVDEKFITYIDTDEYTCKCNNLWGILLWCIEQNIIFNNLDSTGIYIPLEIEPWALLLMVDSWRIYIYETCQTIYQNVDPRQMTFICFLIMGSVSLYTVNFFNNAQNLEHHRDA